MDGSDGADGSPGAPGSPGTSLSIIGTVADESELPSDLGSADAGQGWITADTGHLHMWDGTTFTDVGQIVGPPGPSGVIPPPAYVGPRRDGAETDTQAQFGNILSTAPGGEDNISGFSVRRSGQLYLISGVSGAPSGDGSVGFLSYVDGVATRYGDIQRGRLAIDPAYVGRSVASEYVARFGNVLGDQTHGFQVTSDGYTDAIFGAGRAWSFWDTAPYPTGRFVGKFYFDANAGFGALDVGPWSIGQHPVHTGFAGIWANGDPSGAGYVLLRSGGAVILNATESVDLRINSVSKLLATSDRVAASTRVGVSYEPTTGSWDTASFYAVANVPRISMCTSGVNAVQIRHTPQESGVLGVVVADSSQWAPVYASQFAQQSAAKVKTDVRSLGPDRERSVVCHPAMADTVPQPDIMALRPVAYRPVEPPIRLVEDDSEAGWHHEDESPDTVRGRCGRRERLGLIAEEVVHVLPSAVAHHDDGEVFGLDYAQITVALLAHVQQLTETVATLQYRITDMEASRP